MDNIWARVIIIAIFVIILVLHLVSQIKKDCKKDPQNCKSRKNKIIGTSLILCGIGIMSPGLTWVPAGIATKKYGRSYGTKILELTIAIGAVISIVGGIIHSV
jgi:hypothetical protein